MDIKDHKELIKRYYKEYKKIGYIECPAFNYEKVYFNKHGFRHLGKEPKHFFSIMKSYKHKRPRRVFP